MNGKSGNVDVGFQKVLTEVYEVKSFEIGIVLLARVNSSGLGMNGFMPEAFENPQGLFFGNVVIL
nr:hypothetical protein [uncultured Draconibacterium sp.]